MADDEDKILKPGAVPIYEAPDGMRVYRMDDLQDGVREHLERQREDPEFQRKLREEVGQTWHYAIADHQLPESADAAVVRWPHSKRALLVFHEKSLNDRLISLARVVYAYTGSIGSRATGQEIVLVWADGTLKKAGVTETLEHLTLSEQGETAKFRKRAGKSEHIMGIGKVRVVGSAVEF